MELLRKYIFLVLMYLLCLEAKALSVPSLNPKLIHYDGCVNIGVPDTLLLRVENPVEDTYRWQIPSEWEPIGCTTCAELRVVTHETAAATRVYGVSLSGAGFAMDTIQVRGADTNLKILLYEESYELSNGFLDVLKSADFDCFWYRGELSQEAMVVNTNTNKPINTLYMSDYLLRGAIPIAQYRKKNASQCWSVTDEVVVYDSVTPVKLEHYDGCVNIGMESELLLRVKNPAEGLRYHWRIPDTWEPVGDTNASELRVITHETQDTTRIYGVRYTHDFWKDKFAFDTVQVKGADTTLYIFSKGDSYLSFSINTRIVSITRFDLMWYKDNLSDENFVVKSHQSAVQQLGLSPLLKYRIKESDACWSVTDEVVRWYRLLRAEIVGNGRIRVYSRKIYYDVTKEGNAGFFVDDVDTLRFVIKPSEGFYLDRIEIEDDEQVTMVPEEKITAEADGTFTFRSSATWQEREGHIDSISKENFRFVFAEKQHILKDLGEFTVCGGDSVRIGTCYASRQGWNYDTVPEQRQRKIRCINSICMFILSIAILCISWPKGTRCPISTART